MISSLRIKSLQKIGIKSTGIDQSCGGYKVDTRF